MHGLVIVSVWAAVAFTWTLADYSAQTPNTSQTARSATMPKQVSGGIAGKTVSEGITLFTGLTESEFVDVSATKSNKQILGTPTNRLVPPSLKGTGVLMFNATNVVVNNVTATRVVKIQ